VSSEPLPSEVGEIGLALSAIEDRLRGLPLQPGIDSIGDHVRIDAFSVLAGGRGTEHAPFVHIGASCYLSAGG
jgi:hypothetical protein